MHNDADASDYASQIYGPPGNYSRKIFWPNARLPLGSADNAASF